VFTAAVNLVCSRTHLPCCQGSGCDGAEGSENVCRRVVQHPWSLYDCTSSCNHGGGVADAAGSRSPWHLLAKGSPAAADHRFTALTLIVQRTVDTQHFRRVAQSCQDFTQHWQLSQLCREEAPALLQEAIRSISAYSGLLHQHSRPCVHEVRANRRVHCGI
jgi:hypothetical protein